MVADYLRWAERTASPVALATMSERQRDGGEFRIL